MAHWASTVIFVGLLANLPQSNHTLLQTVYLLFRMHLGLLPILAGRRIVQWHTGHLLLASSTEKRELFCGTLSICCLCRRPPSQLSGRPLWCLRSFRRQRDRGQGRHIREHWEPIAGQAGKGQGVFLTSAGGQCLIGISSLNTSHNVDRHCLLQESQVHDGYYSILIQRKCFFTVGASVGCVGGGHWSAGGAGQAEERQGAIWH